MVKHFFLMALVCFSISIFMGCAPTRIYVVRHAEKSLNGSKDPVLTLEGEERAITLADLLKRRKIERFYATETQRAFLTAKPLAELMKKQVSYYSSDSIPQFIINVLDTAVNTLVVGHSNTVLKILYDMGLNPSIKEIGDNDYDNLFIISLRNKNGRVGYTMSLNETHYGKSSTKNPKK